MWPILLVSMALAETDVPCDPHPAAIWPGQDAVDVPTDAQVVLLTGETRQECPQVARGAISIEGQEDTTTAFDGEPVRVDVSLEPETTYTIRVEWADGESDSWSFTTGTGTAEAPTAPPATLVVESRVERTSDGFALFGRLRSADAEPGSVFETWTDEGELLSVGFVDGSHAFGEGWNAYGLPVERDTRPRELCLTGRFVSPAGVAGPSGVVTCEEAFYDRGCSCASSGSTATLALLLFGLLGLVRRRVR